MARGHDWANCGSLSHRAVAKRNNIRKQAGTEATRAGKALTGDT